MAAQRPNFLIIQADQAAAQWLPVYGHPVVRMPHLAALAEQGVVFENAYCNSPLCAPSRFSMLAGQLPSRIGAYDNAAEFPAAIPCFTHYLRLLGYRTILSGKMHFVGPDQLHGFEERLTTDVYPADFTWTPDWQRPERMLEWFHTMVSVVQAGECTASMDLDFDDDVAFQAVRKIHTLVREPEQRPFCLFVSFTHPHDPYIMPPAYWNRYRTEEIDLPAIPTIPLEHLDPHSQRLWRMYALDEYAITEQHIRAARHGYYAALSYVDDKIGQLVQALRETGQAENTIILFTADHGDMLGERGLWYKMSLFEGSARVPLLCHAPQRFSPRRVTNNVSLVDLLPTLVDLANHGKPLDWAAPLAGRSLLPHLTGAGNDDHDTALAEYLAEGTAAPCLMIRRGRYKFIACPTDPDQLYDLQADPHELHNLAGQVAYAALHTEFQREVQQGWDVTALREQVIASQQQRHLVAQALATGRIRGWDFQPHSDATQQYIRTHKEFWELLRQARYPAVPAPQPVRVIERFVNASAYSATNTSGS